MLMCGIANGANVFCHPYNVRMAQFPRLNSSNRDNSLCLA